MKIKIKAVKKMFNLENQLDKKVDVIMTLATSEYFLWDKSKESLKDRFILNKNLKIDSKYTMKIDKEFFKNKIFESSKYNFYKNYPEVNILAKNPVVYMELSKKLTKKTKKQKLKFVGIRYSGMKFTSSFISNKVGVPILYTNKILTPDFEFEKKVAKNLKKITKNVYKYQSDDIFDFMDKFKTVVYYIGNKNELFFWKILKVNDVINDPMAKSIFEKLLIKYQNTNNDEKFLLLDNGKIFKIDDVRNSIQIITEKILGKDLKEFKEHQKKSKSVSKIKILTNFDKLISSLNGEPFEHQKTGISWIYSLYQKKVPGTILADEMGMGKTFQSIGFLTILLNKKEISEKKKVVVVCPASVVSVWEKEIKNFNSKLLKYVEIYSFEKFSRRDNKSKIEVLIIDEAQRAKNKNTIINRSLSQINANFVLLLSGTVIENRVEDLYNILTIVDPVYAKIFNILRKIKKDQNQFAIETRKLIDSIYLQRVKTKKELEAKLDIETILIPMTKEEENIHKKIINFYGNAKIKKNAVSTIEYYNQFIIALGRLRQVVSYVKQLEKLKFLPNKISEKSSKIEKLIKILKSKKDEKFVIFTSFSETISSMRKEIEDKLKTEVLVIDGSKSTKERGKIIKKFQENSKNKYIIVSLKAGNTGITLHSASNIIIYDLWWNPAILQQAIARVHRIGQKNNVKAYLFANKKSIDENILRILDLKQGILDAFNGKNISKIDEKSAVEKLIEKIF